MVKLNKKGLEEQGMHFSTGNIIKIILFLLLVAIIIIIVIPRLTAEKSGETLYNFGSGIFEVLTGE